MSTPGIQVESLSDDEINDMLSDSVSDKDLLNAPKESAKSTKKAAEQEDIKKDEEIILKDKKTSITDLDLFDEEDEKEDSQEDVETEEVEETEEEKYSKAEKAKIKKEAADVKKAKAKETEAVVDYKAVVNYLVEEGVFSDFEERETFDFDKDSFAELLKYQATNKVEEVFEQKINSLGDVAKQLIEFEANNGDPRQLLDIFKQQRDIESLDLEKIEDQEEVVREYYERAGKSSTWINKQINLLKEEGEEALKSEAEENKKLILDSVKEDLQATQQAQKEFEQRRQAAEQQFNSTIKKLIHSENLPDREKREMEKFYFDYKHVLDNGSKANDFRLKFLEIQNDPKKYYKFVKFIKDFDKFENETDTANKVKKQTFDFLRKSQSDLTKKTTASPEFASNKNKAKNPFTI